MATKARSRVQRFSVNGFAGMRDQRSPTYGKGEMDAIFDMVPESVDRPGKYLVRPGFKRFKPNGNTTAAQVAPAGSFRFDSAVIGGENGSIGAGTYICSGGEFYVTSTVGYTATKQVTAANLVTAGVVATSPTSMVGFNNKIIAAPYGGVPYSWDGTAGAAGITKLTNAPATVYAVAVYAGKLFFVSDTAGSTIKWSEELSENTGYSSGGFANTWDLSIVSQSPIQYLVGMEAGLYVFRARGITVIRGQVNPNFSTTATRDAISDTIGTPQLRYPPTLIGTTIYFWDQQSRPYALRNDTLVPLWEYLPRPWGAPQDFGSDSAPYDFSLAPDEQLTTLGPGFDSGGSVVYDQRHRLVLMSLWGSGVQQIYAVDPESLRIVAIWRVSNGANIGGMFPVYASDGEYRPGIVDGDGYLYTQDENINTSSNFNDETNSAVGNPVVGTIIGPPHGWTQTGLYRFLEARVTAEARSTHTVNFAYVTSHENKGSLTSGTQAFGPETPTNVPFERRVRFGLTCEGRWIRPQIQVTASAGATNQAGCYGYEIDAVGIGFGEAY